MSLKSIIVTLIILIVLGAAAYLGYQLYLTQQVIVQKDEDLKGAEELLEYEKKQTERDIQALAAEVDGYDMSVSNDTLLQLLESQKQKIQQLLEEIRTVKHSNGKRISELKEEISVVRKVLLNYIRQVDSLNRINKGLLVENTEVKGKILQVEQTNQALSYEKNKLSEVVSRASMLETENFVVATYNYHDKLTNRVDKIRKIAFSFDIIKNITSSVGEKTVFIRIMQPNNEVLTKGKSNHFKYENATLTYSIKKNFVYKGDKLRETAYYEVSETLLDGKYKADFFIEGQLVGSTSFVLN